MTTSQPPRSDRRFADDMARLLAGRPVDVPGHELRAADSGWADLSADFGDALTVTLFPTDEEQFDLVGSWVVAARPDEHYRYQRLDGNGQCRIRDLAPGRWEVRLLIADRARSAPGDFGEPAVGSPSSAPDPGLLLESVSDDDPITCCEALDALRTLADGEAWPAAEIEPIVRQLRENPEAIVRRAAAEVLGELGGAAAVAPLLAAGDDPVWSVQCAAVVSLGLVADSRAAARLGEICDDLGRDPAVREAAEEALDRLGETVPGDPFLLMDRPPFPPLEPVPALAMMIEPIAVGRFAAIAPGASAVDEVDGAALLIHPDPLDDSGGTVVLAVVPGDAVAGHIGSLWAVGSVRVHSGVFDRLGQLQLRSVRPGLRYEVRIHPPGQPSVTRTVREVADPSASPVLVRGTSIPARQRLVPLLEMADPGGRVMTIYRSAENTIVAEIVGLGITDRRLVVGLPVQSGGGQAYLLAPLRWNHKTDRCEARLVLRDTDRLDADGRLEVYRVDTLGPESADAVDASVHRAHSGTVDAWAALVADPDLHPRIASVIRGALAARRPPTTPKRLDE